MGFRDWLARFMAGRYGRDQLNRFLTAVCLVLLLISFFMRRGTSGRGILFYLAAIVLLIVYYRMLSRNYEKRAAENRKYLQIKLFW